MRQTDTLSSVPDPQGHFGPFGGTYVPETLVLALKQLEDEYAKAKKDPAFHEEFERYLRDYVGRPSRLYFARKLTEKLGGAKIYLKREDLNHTGAHKINNCIGQGDFDQADGQEADHRRDRRRAAWRGQRDGGGAVWV